MMDATEKSDRTLRLATQVQMAHDNDLVGIKVEDSLDFETSQGMINEMQRPAKKGNHNALLNDEEMHLFFLPFDYRDLLKLIGSHSQPRNDHDLSPGPDAKRRKKNPEPQHKFSSAVPARASSVPSTSSRTLLPAERPASQSTSTTMSATVANPASLGGRSRTAPPGEAPLGEGIVPQLSSTGPEGPDMNEMGSMVLPPSLQHDIWEFVQGFPEAKVAKQRLAQAQHDNKAQADRLQELTEKLREVKKVNQKLSDINKAQADRLRELTEELSEAQQKRKPQKDEIQQLKTKLSEALQALATKETRWITEKALREKLIEEHAENLQQIFETVCEVRSAK